MIRVRLLPTLLKYFSFPSRQFFLPLAQGVLVDLMIQPFSSTVWLPMMGSDVVELVGSDMVLENSLWKTPYVPPDENSSELPSQ